jgi:DNA (cytosine-5)-methyltransferase 1
MRYLSVCSGIEAASVAWKGLGWTPVAFSEVEPFPCSVLTKRFPHVPNVGDMTRIDGRKFRGTVDLLVGGTPCQGFSVAGKRSGLSDIRSGLVMHFVRLVSEIKPGWIVWENVPGAFSTASGRDFGAFVRTLDECGYHLAWRVLDAQFFGVPQRRRRIFLVGHSGDWRHPAAVLFEPGCLRRDSPTGGKKRQDVTQALTGCLGAGGADDNRAQGGFYVPEIVSQAMSCKWAKGTSGPAGNEYHNLVCASLTTRPYADNDAQESRLVISCPGVRRLTPLECERLQGFPDGWADVLHEGRPASDSARYKALGNSMAVPVMRWIGERIRRVEDGWDVV